MTEVAQWLPRHPLVVAAVIVAIAVAVAAL